MPTEQVAVVQQIIELGVAGILALTMLVIAVAGYLFMRYLMQKQKVDAEVINEIKASNTNNADAIRELREQRQTIKDLSDTAVRIETSVGAVAKDTYRTAENSEATVRDMRALQQALANAEQNILRALTNHENQAIKRNTSELTELDNLLTNFNGLSTKLGDVKTYFTAQVDAILDSQARIIRYTKSVDTNELPSTGSLNADTPASDSDTGELPAA